MNVVYQKVSDVTKNNYALLHEKLNFPFEKIKNLQKNEVWFTFDEFDLLQTNVRAALWSKWLYPATRSPDYREPLMWT